MFGPTVNVVTLMAMAAPATKATKAAMEDNNNDGDGSGSDELPGFQKTSSRCAGGDCNPQFYTIVVTCRCLAKILLMEPCVCRLKKRGLDNGVALLLLMNLPSKTIRASQ